MEDEWFKHPEWWFSGSEIDAFLRINYYDLLDREDHEGIDAILVWDQLPRHVFRGQPCAHVIDWFLKKALDVKLNLDALDDERLCFALLPLRHAGRWREAAEAAWNRVDRIGEASATLRRFLKATYDRAPISAGRFSASESYRDTILEHNPSGEPLSARRLRVPSDTKIVMSLSGGVDSMLCSAMLKGAIIACVHVNYRNRETSDAEAEFACWWSRHALGVPCMIRTIDEIKREPCMKNGLRETYEAYTRKVRFECYRSFGEDAIVVLGHNKDDVLENIFTNIANKKKIDDLRGMCERSKVDGINFWRPLLGMSKSEIYDEAKRLCVPYLPSSTPPWSMRGQIRASVIPALNAWNPGFIDSLFELSETVSEICEQAKICASIAPIGGDWYSIEKRQATSKRFWKHLLENLNMRASSKSIENLCDRLTRVEKEGRIVLSKEFLIDAKPVDRGWMLKFIRS